jgi:hypothetical protein
MAEQRGTLEGLVGSMTRILSPLAGLTPAAAPQFFGELGLPLTEVQATQLAPALSVTSSATGDLVGASLDLDVSVDAQQFAKVVQQVAEAGNRITAVINGFGQLKTKLAGLGLPGAGPILADFPKRLLDLLLAKQLPTDPGIAEVLEFLGILVRTDHNVTSPNAFYTQYEFHLDRLTGWLSKPAEQLKALYGWGTPGFNGTALLQLADRLAAEAGLPVLYDPTASPPSVDVMFAVLVPQLGLSPRGVGLRLPYGLHPGTVERTQAGWMLTMSLDAGIPPGTMLTLQPGKVSVKPPGSSTVNATAKVGYQYVRDSADPLLLVSLPGGSHISVEQVDASIAIHLAPSGAVDVTLGAALRRGKVLIDTGSADGFIATILGGVHINSSFELPVRFSITDGVHFEGSSALEIQLASHVDLGPVQIPRLTLLVGVKQGSLVVGLAADLRVNLGPMVGVVEGIGTEIPLQLTANNKGNFGPLDVRPRFKPPTGIGLALDLDVVSGGGFLKYSEDSEEYAGTLELSLLDIVTVKAIGLLATRMPDGSPGFSLLIILTAEFGTGIQLGFGFTLIGVGGLVGVNRTMLFQPIMDGVRTGAIESVMFPKDVVANAPKIINDVRAFFPPQPDTFLVGPMAKLGWGTPTLISLSLGVIIQIPPGDIAILGVLRVALPADALAVLELQVNFAGALEFSKQRLYFFATLFDSHVLFITLEGEMGLLVAWGDNANFVVSVGGFHPQFSPPPMPFPAPRRIAVSILNDSHARIRCEGYFAVTSNTVQFGSRAEYYFGYSSCSLSGHSGFDALVQFSPFHFTVAISTHFSVKVFGMGVFGIGIKLKLSGPTPWHANGSATLEFLFFDIDIHISFTWGDDRDTTLPPIKAMPILAGEFAKPSNWRAVLPAGANLLVSLRNLGETEQALVLHPVGTLQISQRAIPLDLTLDKIGNAKPDDANRFELTVASSGLEKTRTLREPFAPAQFTDFDDAARISQPAFTPQDSGLELSAKGQAYASATAICRIVRYDVTIIDTKLRPLILKFVAYLGAIFHFGLRGNATARSALSAQRARLRRPFDGAVTVNPPTYVVAWQANNTAYHRSATFTSPVSAQDYLNRTVAKEAGLTDKLHVLLDFEVAA